jgi:Zn-dependent protease with chaperone function
MNYTGRYFDGQTAKPKEVEVTIRSRMIDIFHPESGFRETVRQPDITSFELIGKDRIIIRFGTEIEEMLDVRSDDFVSAFKEQFPSAKNQQNILERFANTGIKGIAVLLAALVGAVLLIYLFVIPAFADMSARFFPVSYEKELGRMIYGNIIKNYDIDTAKTELVNELVQHVDFRSPYELHFTVVDYDQKNAFAMPGGYILIFSGIMDDMENYSELMGLLAHEVSHVNERHTLRALFRSLSSFIFISILLNDVNGLTTIVLENVNTIRTMSFSRSLEKEADMKGLEILFHNNIDPNGMVKLFENLMKDGDVPDELEFMSTHPITEKRISYLEETIKESDYTEEENQQMTEAWERLKGITPSP